MALRLRRGTNAERLAITPAEGELIYTTDTKKIFTGDGSTVNDSALQYFNSSQNITGRFTWMRVKVTGFTQGVIMKITLSY